MKKIKNALSDFLLAAGFAAVLLSGCQSNGLYSTAGSAVSNNSASGNGLLLSVQETMASADLDSDAVLDFEEKKAIMDKLQNATEITPELKQAIVSLFDKNGDGAISEDEVPSRVPAKHSLENAEKLGGPHEKGRPMFCPPSDAEIPEISSVEDFVKNYDSDGDGLISQSEIPGWAVIVNLEENIRNTLLESGILNISVEELPGDREELLADLDTDGDGLISTSEIASSSIINGGLRSRPRFRGHGDRAMSNRDCKESCNEIFRFYQDLFDSFTDKADFITTYDKNKDGMVTSEELPEPTAENS